MMSHMSFFNDPCALNLGIGILLLVGLCSLTDSTNNNLIFRFKDDDHELNNSIVGVTSCLQLSHKKHERSNKMSHSGTGKQSEKPLMARTIIVDKSGSSGSYKTVQAAVDAVDSGNTDRVTIQISAGTFVEKVYVPSSKPYITFQGAGLDKSIISWNDNANATGSTYTTASVAVDADYFIGRNISFKNTAPRPGTGVEGAQAVAFRAAGDKGAFYGCGFYGNQDTLNDQQGRHFFKECYIEGEIDFIFGHGRSLYKKCKINSTATGWGCITAHYRQSIDQDTGYGFVDCSIVGTGSNYLGRAWGPAARVVYASTYMSDIINATGWDDWSNKSADATVYFGEYKNTGPGASTTGRVSYSKALTSTEAAEFTKIAWINGSDWLLET